jgi:hypothetical protein
VGGGQSPGDSIPPVAQLKLLRDMQVDVKKRTEAFARQHPDLNRLGDKDRAELQSIRREQQDLRELLDEYQRPAGEGGAEEGGKR